MEIRLLVLATLVLVSGCTTVEFVRKDFTPNKQATLRYPAQSSQIDDTKYRKKLNTEAIEFCGGEYIITKEYQAREVGSSAVGVGTGVGIGAGSIFMGTTDRGSSMNNFAEISCK
jgi:hypothetical protein